MTRDEAIAEITRRLVDYYRPERIYLFGSVARGEASDESDVDFLVDFEPGRSLLDLGGLRVELEALLGRRVDVVTEAGIYWLLRRRILNEARAL